MRSIFLAAALILSPTAALAADDAVRDARHGAGARMVITDLVHAGSLGVRFASAP